MGDPAKRRKKKTGFRIFSVIKAFFFINLTLAFLSLCAAGGWFAWVVILAPGDDISPENIDRILAVESPVFYADGKEKIGVFFEEAHREYITYPQIPEEFVKSLLAAEDRTFFEHHGVDWAGVLRALWVNLRAGRVVQGGSTITQQTAKNLFKRKDRSLGSKVRELIYALRLEYHYPKEKILEFYVNQFFVSGNGHGLSVAARYYFDKKVDELDQLECAFIAGSLKRPNYYNPFTKREGEQRETALRHAHVRLRYVLNQMHKFNMIDTADYEKYVKGEIPFKEGKMSYPLDTVMDLVKSALSSPEVEDALLAHGIDNVATSGIKIVTTVDKQIQDASLIALRKGLSKIDVQLSGYDRPVVQDKYSRIESRGEEPEVGTFLFGSIVKINTDPELEISVSWQEKKGEHEIDGIIDTEGVTHLLKPFAQHKRNRWATVSEGDLDSLVKQLHQGDMVYVHLRNKNDIDGSYLLNLEKYPEVEGSVIVLEKAQFAQ